MLDGAGRAEVDRNLRVAQETVETDEVPRVEDGEALAAEPAEDELWKAARLDKGARGGVDVPVELARGRSDRPIAARPTSANLASPTSQQQKIEHTGRIRLCRDVTSAELQAKQD